jgi:hypothetical protein
MRGGVNRRQLLQAVTGLAAGATTALSLDRAEGAHRQRGMVIGWKSEETAAIDQALGKKGQLVEDQGSTRLPCPVTI